MTSLVRHQLHKMVDTASDEAVLNCVLTRTDVSRFLLHSFVDHCSDNGTYDSGFGILFDWSNALGVSLDCQRSLSMFPPMADDSEDEYEDDTDSDDENEDDEDESKKADCSSDGMESTEEKATESAMSSQSEHTIDSDTDNVFITAPTTHTLDDASLLTLHDSERDSDLGVGLHSSGSDTVLLNSSAIATPKKLCVQKQKEQEKEQSSKTKTSKRRKLPKVTASRSLPATVILPEYYSPRSSGRSPHSARRTSPRSPRRISARSSPRRSSSPRTKKTLYSPRPRVRRTHDGVLDLNPLLSRFRFELSAEIWTYVAHFCDTMTVVRGLWLVSRELNLVTTHYACWRTLTLTLSQMAAVPLSVVKRSFKRVRCLELDWSDSAQSVVQNKDKLERFLQCLNSACAGALTTFKLKSGGGPFRLANSAPTRTKFQETNALVHVVFANVANLRKFKLDKFNIVSLQSFEEALTRWRRPLVFCEVQVLVFDPRVSDRPLLETPVALSANVLPQTLRHLALPLLADNSWITAQQLPELRYLFFYGFERSSAYALHENHLTVDLLRHASKQCPKLVAIEVALRQSDYLAVILRPALQRLFGNCSELQSIKLATAGNLELGYEVSRALQRSKLKHCDARSKLEGRPERPVGFIQFTRILPSDETKPRRKVSDSLSVSEMDKSCKTIRA